MSLWILDTDHVSLFLEGNPQIRKQAAGKFPNVAVTIITVQEIFNGWTGRINKLYVEYNLLILRSFCKTEI
jgi:tRNA(fMet)-specific endonuclease VapC